MNRTGPWPTLCSLFGKPCEQSPAVSEQTQFWLCLYLKELSRIHCSVCQGCCDTAASFVIRFNFQIQFMTKKTKRIVFLFFIL